MKLSESNLSSFLFLLSLLVAGASAAAVTSCEEGEMLCPGGVDGNSELPLNNSY